VVTPTTAHYVTDYPYGSLQSSQNNFHYILQPNMSCFRKNLRDELDYQGLTVKELAAKSSVAKGALDSYLGVQERIPSADNAVKIADVLGVSVKYLKSD
jgi:hypothetical protein